MATASSKSSVLVILPPTHTCPDLGRVLNLARKAFVDPSLNILDLNLRFAWVSGDELVKDETSAVAHDGPKPSTADPISVVRGKPTPTSQSAAWELSVEPFAKSSDMAVVWNPGHAHDPAQSADKTFSTTCNKAMSHHPHAHSHESSSAPLPLPVQDAVVSEFDHDTLPGSGTHILKFEYPPVLDSDWRLIVGSLKHDLSDQAILEAVIPPNVAIKGVNLPPPRLLGALRRERVRSVGLSFHSELDAIKCYEWVRKPGGNVAALIVPGCNLSVGRPREPYDEFAVAQQKAKKLAEKAKRLAKKAKKQPMTAAVESESKKKPMIAAVESKPPTICREPLQPTNLGSEFVHALPVTDPEAPFRLIAGHFYNHLSKEQLFSGLVPLGVTPTGMSVLPLRQLSGRDEVVRSVLLSFSSLDETDKCAEWIKEQAYTYNGTVDAMLLPKIRLAMRTYVPQN